MKRSGLKRKPDGTFLQRAEGFVSVYFIAILSAIFLFQSVLFEFARIRSAQLHAEYAAAAAVRSVMSQVNPALREYGLFGLDEAGSMQLIADVIGENLASQGIVSGTGRWVKLDWQPEHAHLNVSGSLADPDIFRLQLLEEMKYRAPIEYMMEVFDKLQDSGVMEATQDAAGTARRLEHLEEIVQRRERHLDHAWNVWTELAAEGGWADRAHDANEHALETIKGLAEQLGEHSREALNRMFERLVAELGEIDRQLVLLMQTGWGEDGEPDEGSARQWEALVALREAKQAELEEVRRLLETARQYAAAILDHYVAVGIQHMELQNMLDTLRLDLHAAQQANEELAQKRDGLTEEMKEAVHVYDLSYFDRRESGMSAVVSLHNGYMIQLTPDRFVTGFDFSAQQEHLSRLNQRIKNEAKSFHALIDGEERKRQQQAAEIGVKQDEQRSRARDILRQMNQMLHACPQATPLPTVSAAHVKLADLERKYAEGAEESGGDPPDPDPDWTDAERIGKRALSLGERLGASLLAVRDKAYMVEYALTKFNYRTHGLGGHSPGATQSHPLTAQEAEYILYGMSSCQKNHSAAFADMFLIRLAIRTAEALMKPEKSIVSAASPWLVFLWALAEGAVHAWNDMQRLVKGEEVELAKWLPRRLAMTYKDYLRVLLLLHAREERIIPRMQALIEMNTGIDLRRKATKASVRLEARLPLLFLSGMARLMGQRAEDGRLIIEREAAYAYQREG